MSCEQRLTLTDVYQHVWDGGRMTIFLHTHTHTDTHTPLLRYGALSGVRLTEPRWRYIVWQCVFSNVLSCSGNIVHCSAGGSYTSPRRSSSSSVRLHFNSVCAHTHATQPGVHYYFSCRSPLQTSNDSETTFPKVGKCGVSAPI